MRWRLDTVDVIGSHIRDYGPAQRECFLQQKRIQRERREPG